MAAKKTLACCLMLSAVLLSPIAAFAADAGAAPAIGPVRFEFIIFALTLLGVAMFNNKTMQVALAGLAATMFFKLLFDPGLSLAEHFLGTTDLLTQIIHKEQRQGEWSVLVNLGGLLFGFAILAKHFEESGMPDFLPRILPDDWTGGLVLLLLIAVMSSFLDNIAAAMIGGTIALVVFRGKVHLGYLAAIIAAANAGGAGSVLGDTTTTLMWIDGVNPFDVSHAFVAAIAAFIIFGIVGSLQQHRFNPIVKDAPRTLRIQWSKLIAVAMILAGAITTNVLFDCPALGVWIAIALGALFTATPWREMKQVWQGTVFLLSLVTIASLMPVHELPEASMWSAFAWGFVSAVFDNIPLTKLCLEQGGYDWGVLAFSVGFGGSMIWFGSSAGVALSNMYPQTRNTLAYISKGWHVTAAYVIAFQIMIALVGWHPLPVSKSHAGPPAVLAPAAQAQCLASRTVNRHKTTGAGAGRDTFAEPAGAPR